MNIQRTYPCVLQENETECGVACLASICLFYGISVELTELRKLTGTDQYGSNLLGLQQAAQALGLLAEGMSGTIEDLLQQPPMCPYIANIMKNEQLAHYVVVYRQSAESFVVADPAVGITQYTKEEFQTVWTGYILTMKQQMRQTPKRLRRSRDKKYLRSFFSLIREQKPYVFFIGVLSLVATALSVAASFFSYYLFDVIVPQYLLSQLFGVVCVAVGIHILILVLNWVRMRMIAALSKRLNHTLLCRYASALVFADYSLYHQYTTGDFITRLQDTDTVRDALTQITITLSLDVVMMFAGALILGVLEWQLLVAVCFVMCCYGIGVAAFRRPIHASTTALREHNGAATDAFMELIHGIEDIKTCLAEKPVLEKNNAVSLTLMESFRRATVVSATQSVFSDTIMAIGEVLVLAIGAVFVIDGNSSFGAVAMFYSLFSVCISPAKNILLLMPTVRRAEVSAKRLQDIFAAASETREPESNEEISLLQDVKVQDVSFHYGNRALVLDHLTFCVKAGEHIALSGSSGAGKTTWIRLLLRLYQAQSGKIYIGENEISTIPLAVLRKKIAYVGQNAHLFRGSVLDNLCMGMPSMPKEAVIQFLESTAYGKIVKSFPLGYRTIVTENGDNLSGGQRQMLQIGRALLKQADILILDEATAAIDPCMRSVIHTAIEEVYRDKTMIVVSHDPSTALPCTRTVYL